MASAEILSAVTSTASFLLVPASRREWANTRAPNAKLLSVILKLSGAYLLPGK